MSSVAGIYHVGLYCTLNLQAGLCVVCMLHFSNTLNNVLVLSHPFSHQNNISPVFSPTSNQSMVTFEPWIFSQHRLILAISSGLNNGLHSMCNDINLKGLIIFL